MAFRLIELIKRIEKVAEADKKIYYSTSFEAFAI